MIAKQNGLAYSMIISKIESWYEEIILGFIIAKRIPNSPFKEIRFLLLYITDRKNNKYIHYTDRFEC
ncbi:hypothetical protein CRH01_20900 [Chryseobacterium rhizosphaerae]|nr:hypothetical protein CRH01_20900 [Chryseobacterium rhizosphaerae]